MLCRKFRDVDKIEIISLQKISWSEPEWFADFQNAASICGRFLPMLLLLYRQLHFQVGSEVSATCFRPTKATVFGDFRWAPCRCRTSP